ncbi:MAG: serine/threonine-protein kinase, partial [Ignavibacteria bacterium]
MLDSTILHYKIIEKLGEGGMGVVYLAEDSRLKRQVAIKFLPHYIAANKEERQRFEIEAQAAASLNHPNISTVYAIEENDDEVFIVMEYIDGEELKDRINPTSSPLLQRGNTEGLEAGEAVNIAIQIAEGLEAAHKKGIIHRDIKSQNIMITKDGKVKIMDFGLAKVNGGSGLTQIGATVGTIAYMSPEQARGIDVDHRTDIWSFGIILYEMITGQPPFKGEYDQAVIYSILNEEPNEISKNQYPSWIINIALKCLQKDPSDRYQSFSELLTDLKDRRTDSKTTVNSSSGKTAVKIFSVKSFKKKPILIIGLSLGLLILFYLSPSAKELFDSLFSSSP